MTDSSSAKLVTVFGGSGFLGRHVVRALANDGWRIRVAVRKPNLAHFLKPMGRVGQIQIVKANIGNDDQVRAALVAANSNRPKGLVEDGERQWWIHANDQAFSAEEYIPLVVAYRNGGAVRLGDVAAVTDSTQDKNNAALSDGKPAVLLIIYREPTANILETVQRVLDLPAWSSPDRAPAACSATARCRPPERSTYSHHLRRTLRSSRG